MLRILIHNWWLLALRGAFALLFGIFVFSVQAIGIISLLRAIVLTSVVELFGLFALVAGLLTIVSGIRGFIRERGWWLLLLDGIGTCVAGLTAVLLPAVTIITLVRLIGFWALFVGSSELLIAHRLRRHLPDEWFLALAAIGSILFGAYMFLIWAPAVHQIFLWLGSYALFSAGTMLALALRLRRLRGLAHQVAHHAASPHA